MMSTTSARSPIRLDPERQKTRDVSDNAAFFYFDKLAWSYDGTQLMYIASGGTTKWSLVIVDVETRKQNILRDYWDITTGDDYPAIPNNWDLPSPPLDDGGC
jgi:hypothetical protein